jgi:hypothetical protein
MAMMFRTRTRLQHSFLGATAALAVCFAVSSASLADENDAKTLLKGMSDYLAAQETISLSYDSVYEVVSKDKQKLQLANSGTVKLSRPDKIHVTRSAGFADIELVFDGKTVSMVDKTENAYVQAEVPGSVDNLIDQLRDKFHRPLPAADLLGSNVYDVLMADVTEVKDLGSGVIGGTECDHLAFRTKELDWQIWIAQGEAPYPCRYVITTTQVDQAPQFTFQVREWKAGDGAVAGDFSFKAPAGAKALDVAVLKELKGLNELPSNFSTGDSQ